MPIDIKIIHDDAYDCLDNILVYLAQWFGRDFELMFAESWGFSYQKRLWKPGESLAGCLEPVLGDTIGLLERYHGVSSRLFNEISAQSVEHIKRELDAGYPIGLYMDGFWNPWNKRSYQKNHSEHYCLVTGINEAQDVLFCKDSQLAVNGEELSAHDFLNGTSRYHTFRLIEDYSPQFRWEEILERLLRRLQKEDNPLATWQSMKQFGEDIAEYLDLKLEANGYDHNITEAPFFQKIFDISRGRKQFSKSLAYLAQQCNQPDLGALAERVKKTGDLWGSFMGMLLKAFYLPEPAPLIRRVSERIKEIAGEEEAIVQLIAQLTKSGCVKDSSFSQVKPVLQELPGQNVRYVDLAKYFNNQGIALSLTAKSAAEFSNGGRYYLLEKFPENHCLEIADLKFYFPEIGFPDNIACEGQVIKAPEGTYSWIMLLGAAEFGNHSEFLAIEYEDGFLEKVPLEFSSWLAPVPDFGEVIAWTGKGAVGDGIKAYTYPFEVHLYAKKTRLNHSGRIRNIILPLCPNIHLFGISLK